MAKRNFIFVGYADKKGTYKLLDKDLNKILRSKDVRFAETIRKK